LQAGSWATVQIGGQMASFSYIAGWQHQGLTCTKCGETRSVKYYVKYEWGKMPYCNICVGSAIKDKKTAEKKCLK
jgi:hypothetical protein